jgi:hypothetical protein
LHTIPAFADEDWIPVPRAYSVINSWALPLSRMVPIFMRTLAHVRGGWRWLASLLLAMLLFGCASGPVKVTPIEATVAPTIPEKRLPKVGLALGGGAARGFAHVGVIQVLEEAGMRPDLVVGTSAGSLVAAIYASGKSGM